jgi:hypothetical protein
MSALLVDDLAADVACHSLRVHSDEGADRQRPGLGFRLAPGDSFWVDLIGVEAAETEVVGEVERVPEVCKMKRMAPPLDDLGQEVAQLLRALRTELA